MTGNVGPGRIAGTDARGRHLIVQPPKVLGPSNFNGPMSFGQHGGDTAPQIREGKICWGVDGGPCICGQPHVATNGPTLNSLPPE